MYLRHPHRKTFNDHIRVEGLKDISRDQGVVHAGIFVVVQLWQVLLPNVDHLVLWEGDEDLGSSIIRYVCWRRVWDV